MANRDFKFDVEHLFGGVCVRGEVTINAKSYGAALRELVEDIGGEDEGEATAETEKEGA